MDVTRRDSLKTALVGAIAAAIPTPLQELTALDVEDRASIQPGTLLVKFPAGVRVSDRSIEWVNMGRVVSRDEHSIALDLMTTLPRWVEFVNTHVPLQQLKWRIVVVEDKAVARGSGFDEVSFS